MNVALVLTYLFPGSDPLRDWAVVDDGSGPRITTWNLPVPQPTQRDLETVFNSTDFQAWKKAELATMIDRDTGRAIDETIHPFAGIEEQVGRNRAQIAAILNAIGLEPLPEFDEFNTIAAEKIAEGRAKKEALNNA